MLDSGFNYKSSPNASVPANLVVKKPSGTFSATNTLSSHEGTVISYTDSVCIHDEVASVLEYDTTGNEKHVVEDVIFFDGVEYTLTDKQKNTLNTMALNAIENEGAEALTYRDYEHFTHLIHA